MKCPEPKEKGKSYLITHGDRFYGPDPGHTEKGFEQIRALIPILPKDISLVVKGTGKRFKEIYETIRDSVASIPVKYSPFCGSADGLEKDGSIILVDGTIVKYEDYLGSILVRAYNAWHLVKYDLHENTLFCAGGEMLIALGGKSINEKGQLYELDRLTCTIRKIS